MKEQAPERRIRAHLERRGGRATVSARRLFALWGAGKPDEARRRDVAEALEGAGIDVSPSLDEVGPRDSVELVLRRSRLSGMKIPGVPGNGTTQAAMGLGFAGVAVGLASGTIAALAILAGIGAIALAVRGRRLAVRHRERSGGGLALAAVAAGFAALALGIPSVLTGNGEDPSGEKRSLSTPSAFCESDDGLELSELSVAAPKTPEELAEATERVFELSPDAPAGAYCAVNALGAMATAWEAKDGKAGFEDAEGRADEIREFQAENDLAEPRY